MPTPADAGIMQRHCRWQTWRLREYSIWTTRNDGCGAENSRQKVVFLTSTLGEYLNFPTEGTGKGKDAQNCTFLSTWSLHVKEKRKKIGKEKKMLRARKGDRTENFHLRDLCSYSKVSCIDRTGAHLTITNSYACSLICTKWIQFERKGEFCDFSLRVGVWKLKKWKIICTRKIICYLK